MQIHLILRSANIIHYITTPYQFPSLTIEDIPTPLTGSGCNLRIIMNDGESNDLRLQWEHLKWWLKLQNNKAHFLTTFEQQNI